MTQRDQIIARLDSIPKMPAMVVKVTQMLNDPEVSFKALADVLQYDPGLTANILRLANSAYFGFASKINSVHQGMVRLGTKRIYELAVAAAIGPFAQQAIKGYDLSPRKLWEHSMAVAVGTEELAKLLKIPAPEFAFTAGLLHDIGKIVLGTFIEVDPEPIFKLVREEKIAFNEAETQILGINHAEVGALLFERWNLPESIIQVIQWHHEPESHEDSSKVTALVHAADMIALMSGIGTGRDGLRYRPSQQVVGQLNLTTDIIEMCSSQILEKVNELIHVFAP